MNCLYACVLFMSALPWYRPKCTLERTYPLVMTLNAVLFLINYIFLFTVNCKKEQFLLHFDHKFSEDIQSLDDIEEGHAA